jgi:hypothetical protein
MVGLVAALALAIGAWWYPNQAAHAYLWAYLAMLGCSLGGLAVLMIHHLVGGGWGGVVRRPLEAAMGVLPWLAVGFLPIALALPLLYPGPAFQAAYMSQPAVLARAACYFAIWCGLAWRLQRLSDAQDRDGAPAWRDRLAATSAAGLVLYALTTFLAAVDWLVALEPGWSSAAMGLVLAAGQVVAGFALGTLTVAWLAGRPPLAGRLKAQHLNDLGNLLLAAVLSWAYLAYAQYLVVWSGNLPADVPWYVHRSNGGWGGLIGALVALHVALPLGVLLFRAPKRHPLPLGLLGAVLLAAQGLHYLWEVTPAVAPVLRCSWLDLAAPVAVGAPWLRAYTRGLASRPLVPLHGEPIEETPTHAY